MTEDEVGKPHRFTECLVISIALEHGDLVLGAAATKIIRRLVARTTASSIIIDGYHRPPTPHERKTSRIDLLADLADSLDLLAEVTERLTHAGENVHTLPFGWHTGAHAHVAEGTHTQHSIRLHVSDPDTGGRVVAALDIPAVQRFHRISALSFSPTCA
ncbi:hypothetical protein [Nocardia jejuensis]|uniref:hypothetical protein n=1 Tax=Nocardia jejuensis TaxID=328049 RepID=UPI00082E3CDD|nr:hypothetical protein [Nocardia jejuensis]